MTTITGSDNKSISMASLTLLLGVLTAFAPFSTDMYLAAFPSLAQDLHSTAGGVSLTLSIFFAGMAIGQLFYGPLIDRFGRRPPLLVGIALFTISSLALVFAGNIELFVTLRFLQAVGGCAGMVIGRAIIQDSFNTNEVARVLSLLMIVQAIGPVAAPIIGGYVLLISSWKAIFVGLSALGAASFCLTFAILPETMRQKPHQAKGEVKTGVLKTFAIILRTRAFISPALAGALSSAAMFAFITGSPFVLMDLYGFSKTSYGWTFGAFALGMTLISAVNRPLLRRYSPATLLTCGMTAGLACAVALLLCLALSSQLPPVALLVALLFFSLSFNPLVIANSAALAMAGCTENTGSASALLGVIQFACAGLVSSLTGMLHNGTPYAMVGMIALCGISGLLVFKKL